MIVYKPNFNFITGKIIIELKHDFTLISRWNCKVRLLYADARLKITTGRDTHSILALTCARQKAQPIVNESQKTTT